MIQYIYFVKCPECADEPFDFFAEAKDYALGCLSKKPIITQIEVNRNDFGECTDSADLGTIWSWEDMMTETEAEPTISIFTKDDLKRMAGGQDPEFDNLDNSVDCEVVESDLEEDILPRGFMKATKAPKDSEYVIVLRNAVNGRCSFFGINSRQTTDINKAMTYPGEFSAEDDIKYAEDALAQQVETRDDHLNSTEFFVTTVAEAKKLQTTRETKADHQARLKVTANDKRKHIPEGMTIEQLVEEMEENEDMVECKVCNDLFDKSECRKEVNLGWLCSRCEAAIKSRGETLTFKENSYRDFLDEEAEEPTKEPESLHDLGNEYDGGYPKETSKSVLEELEDADVYRERLALCPECGENTFDHDTGLCLNCGFNTLD